MTVSAKPSTTDTRTQTGEGTAARFPSQYYDLHPEIGLNFQFNRMYGWVGEDCMLEELRDVAPRIHDYDDWRREFLKLGEAAIAQGRTLPGAYYLRLAEFFMFPGDPNKKATRNRFLELVLVAHGLSLGDRQLISFENGFLPAYRFTPPNPSFDTQHVLGGHLTTGIFRGMEGQTISSQDYPLRGARILVVEDDAILALDMAELLARAGAEIIGPALTLADALALAETANLTSAVLDVKLRDDLVFPAAQALKERGITIIFYTSHGDVQVWGGTGPMLGSFPSPFLRIF